ncbi:MAG: toll/interleukin-1 receptor domain-containing protein [Acidimicrobiales bacterium]|jgi:hypothetical protein|nr:toll/interleukin-1 receptor domain-containing protein [Acidimicrobiales bacterium]
MDFGTRVELIKKVSRSLAAQGWADAGLIARQANLRHLNEEGELYESCLWSVEDASDETLLLLDAYLHSATSTAPEDEPWQDADRLRLFLSHLAAHRATATELAQTLSRWGIEGFVAHVSIEPNREWQRVIEASLATCDALAALLHADFLESRWCDQEVGFVFGRHQPVISLSYEVDPHGFLGNKQAINARQRPEQVAPEIVKLLLTDRRSGAAMSAALVQAIARSPSWRFSNEALPLLRDHGSHLTTVDAATLRRAQKTNVEVGDAAVVNTGILDEIETRHSIQPTVAANPAGYDPDEEPF